MSPVCRSLTDDTEHRRCFSSDGYEQLLFCLFTCSFFITAPRVFRVGVHEKVFVQMGKAHLNTLVTLYLEKETGGIVSEQKTVECSQEREIKEVELMV